MRLSDYVMNFLYEQGVKDMFMLPGGGCIHLAVSLMRSNINCIVAHDEQTCSFAAEAYAKYKETLGCVLVTSGPGATNTVTALKEAYIDSVPCLFISGQVKSDQTLNYKNIPALRQVGVQEVDIISMVRGITKYAVLVDKPEKIKFYLEKALHIAQSGRPGPVWLDIPIDIQGALVEEDALTGFEVSSNDVPADEQEDLDYVLQCIKQAERPVILAGQGVRLSHAGDDLKYLAEKFKIPVVTSYLGKDLLDKEVVNNIGCIGFKGTRPANLTVQNADLLISIGCRISLATSGYAYDLFAAKAKKIVVDIDAAEHKKDTVKIDKLVLLDAKQFLRNIVLKLENYGMDFSAWLEQALNFKQKYPVCAENYKNDYPDGINLYNFIDSLTAAVDKSIPIVADTGSALFVTAQAGNINKGQRYIFSGFAAMGFSLPGAIGVSFAKEKGLVIGISGDGSIQQNLQDLQTIVHHKLPVKLFVLNNQGYYTMKHSTNKGYDANFLYNTLRKSLSFPDWEKIASAYGINYVSIKNNHDIKEKLNEKNLYSMEPVLFDVKTSNELDVYTVTTFHKEDGTISARPLHDMFPFLEREELKKNMIKSRRIE